jgi:hypothetical protein
MEQPAAVAAPAAVTETAPSTIPRPDLAAVRASLSRVRVAMRGGRLTLTQTFPLGGHISWRLRPTLPNKMVAGAMLAGGRREISSGNQVTTRLTLTRRGRAALRRGRSVRVVLTTAFGDRLGRRTIVRTPLTIRAR